MTKLFSTYEAAIAFCTKQGIVSATKPYRRLVWIDGTQVPVWSVSLSNIAVSTKRQREQILTCATI